MIPFCKVKVASQDDPATVSQIRALHRNLRFIERCWRPTIWSQMWSKTNPGALATDYITPIVYIPPSPQLRLVVICGGSGSVTVTCEITNSTVNETITQTATRSGTYTVVNRQWDRSAQGQLPSYAPARLKLSTDTTGDLYYWGLFADYDDNQSYITVPEMFECADDAHLRDPSAVLNWFATQPQYLGGWTGSSTGHAVAVDAYATWFRHYHLYDKSDDTLSLDKAYTVGLCVSATAKSSSARSLDLKNSHRESSDSENPITQYDDADYVAEQYTSLLGESYSTGSGTQSAVVSEVKRTSGDNTIYLNGWSLHSYDTSPLSTTRQQSTSGAACDPDYYGMYTGQVVDTDTVTAIGRAQFNAVFLRSGQYTSWMYPAGESISLTTSFVDQGYFVVLCDDLWLAPVDTKYVCRYTLTAVIEDNAANTVETRLTSVNTSDTDTDALTTINGVGYLTCSGDITLSPSSGVDTLILALRDKNASNTITVHSLIIQLRYDTTY